MPPPLARFTNYVGVGKSQSFDRDWDSNERETKRPGVINQMKRKLSSHTLVLETSRSDLWTATSVDASSCRAKTSLLLSNFDILAAQVAEAYESLAREGGAAAAVAAASRPTRRSMIHVDKDLPPPRQNLR